MKGKEKDKGGGNAGSNGGKKVKDLSHVECWNCGEKGHYARDCTEPAADPTNGCTLSFAMSCSTPNARFRPYEITIDNCSDVSIVHSRFLHDIKPADCGWTAIGGPKSTAGKVGYLKGFFEVICCDTCVGSILSQSAIENLYRITYVQGETYTVYMSQRDLVFYKRGNLYYADFSDWIVGEEVNYATLTRKETRLADRAGELVRVAGYPSQAEAEHLVADGNLVNVPVDVKHVRDYYMMHGEPVASVRGKLTKKKPDTVAVAAEGIQRTVQELSVDVMEVCQQPFLVSVSEPLNLTIQCHLESEGRISLGRGLQDHLSLLSSRGFKVNKLYGDPQFDTLERSFPEITFDVQGAADHLAKVDIKIRRVKEICRSVLSSLPYNLPGMLVKDIVTYAVNRINCRRTTSLMDNRAPRVLFTGRRIDYKKEFKCGFGDYVESYASRAKSN